MRKAVLVAPNTSETPANGESGPDALVEQRGQTLIVTMNRPSPRNALSGEMMQIMVEAWDRVDNDPDIRCCILTGAGGYFCAGMDLKAATKKPPGDSFKDGSYDPSRIDALLKGRRLKKPLISAVEGPAIAGGTEILQGTDIRVAAESAEFGISEAKWSLYPMGGSAVRLVRQIPYTVACDLLLTGRHITAAEAKEMGLVGHVVPDGQALTKALEIAEIIAANGPLAVQAILRTIRETEGMHENEAFKIDTRIGIEVFLSDDAKERRSAGVRAEAQTQLPEPLISRSACSAQWPAGSEDDRHGLQAADKVRRPQRQP
ncbi:enoyl-CoA hydratase [Mycobacterium shottsii]|uniref:Enoyl-CoA hydratase EchA19 n=1 Tax=Mycobacterium shottsii TaxID=133549 RepID=A0A7I7L7A9_9MYCO|nr:enoyl-CoA hydratase [Mycobacterium shottsii]